MLAVLAIGPARARTRHPLLVAAAVSIAYGAALEGVQALCGWRTADVADLLANGAGTWAGILVPSLWRRV